MQNNTFSGLVAAAPISLGTEESKVLKFTLINNEYAGKDKDKEKITIQFTAFGQKADILEKVMTGDQLIINYNIRNNNYTKEDGTKVYSYNFTVNSFDFGAPGKLKREELQGNAA